jgi:hypothetical protein
MMSKDRGQNIRTEQQWKDLAGSVFPSFFTNILTGVNRWPWRQAVPWLVATLQSTGP